MLHRSVVAVAVLATLLALAPSAFGQTVAELSGRVTDETGGALPGVVVTVTQTDTGATREVFTNAAGDYIFTALPVGPYRLTARLDGFRAFGQTGIVLAVGESRALNVRMTLGALNETVTVVADATLVETRDVGVGRLVEQEQIVSLPLNGRDVNQLVILAGNAVDVGLTSGNRAYPGGVGISVAGGTGNSTLYQLDGQYNNDPQNNSGNAMPFPDALQEFSVETGVRSARYGQSTGATVNAVTRSGTNTFHGSAFVFGRHHRFNAIRFFERAENGGLGRDDGLKRAQSGGTAGGPIIRDKVFFFGGVQVTNNRIRPLANNQIVPTAEMRRGDFRRFMSAECRGDDRTLGFPFVNNQIDPALFDPISVKIMELLPVPDPAIDPDGCGRYVSVRPDDSDEQQYIGRVDYQVAANHRAFGRYFYSKYVNEPLFDIDTNPDLTQAGGDGGGNDARMQTFAGGWDWVMSPSLLSSTRVSHQYTATLRLQGKGVPTWRSLGVNTFQYTKGDGQDFLRGGTAGWSGNALTGTFYVRTPSLSQHFDWSKGSHTMSFGGAWTRPNSDGDGTFQSNGQVEFSGIFTSGTSRTSGGHAMADFVLGLPSRFFQGGSQINNQVLHSGGLYVQDVWRVNRNLTLNSGLRWEPYISPVDRNRFTSLFSRELFEQGVKSAVYPNAPAGEFFPGDPQFDFLAKGKNHRNDWNKWAPRFGFVWDPKGDTMQTIRGGIGHFYDAPKLWTYAHHVVNPPYGNTSNALPPETCPPPNRNGCPVLFEDPWRYTPGGDPLAGRARQGEAQKPIPPDTFFPLQGEYKSTPEHVETMQSTQWNIAYERQLPGRMMVDVTYMGSRTRNIWVGYNENPVIYIPGNCQAGEYGLTRPGPCSNSSAANRQARALLTLIDPVEGAKYGAWEVLQLYDQAKGRYHSLRIGLQKRMGNGWSANANYTRSQCINQGEPETNIANVFPVTLRDPFNDPRPDASTNEGPCEADRPHLFNLSSVLLSPGVGSGLVRAITKDWQVGLIYQARSGWPLTVTVDSDYQLTDNDNQRAVIVPGVDPYLPESQRTLERNRGGLRWLNMDAFARNSPGDWGNVPKGYLRGPSYGNVDMALSRRVPVGDGKTVELRVEAFNLFDTVNWSNPETELGDRNEGLITNTGDPRIMQFAVKFGF